MTYVIEKVEGCDFIVKSEEKYVTLIRIMGKEGKVLGYFQKKNLQVVANLVLLINLSC